MVLSDDIRARVTAYIQHQGTKSPDALIDLVSTSQQRFLDLASNVAEDVAARQPAPLAGQADEWSMRDLVRHVIGAESMVAVLVHDLARGTQAERRGGLGMMIEDDGRPFAQFVQQLREANDAMLESIRTLPPEPNLELKAPHPFFGPLNCREWAAFQRVHDEDHVQHATKIIAAVASA